MNKSMEPEDEMPDFRRWAEANAPRHFSIADYIQAQMLKGNTNPDLVASILLLLWPRVILLDKVVILSDLCGQIKYEEFVAQGLSDQELEYWCNMTNLDGIFPGMPAPLCAYLANEMSLAWKCKLKIDFPDR